MDTSTVPMGHLQQVIILYNTLIIYVTSAKVDGVGGVTRRVARDTQYVFSK